MDISPDKVLAEIRKISQIQKISKPIGIDTLCLSLNALPADLQLPLKELEDDGFINLIPPASHKSNNRKTIGQVMLIDNQEN